MRPVPNPHVYRSRILAPGLSETLKFSFCRLEAGSTIHPLELGGERLVVLGRDILYGIADQMNDAALNNNVLEDRSGTLFQS